MYNVKNGNVYRLYTTNENKVEICIGSDAYDEEIKNEKGEVIETINYKFNLDKGSYEVI